MRKQMNLFVLIFLSSIFSTAYAQKFEGFYHLSGSDSALGPYQGSVQIKNQIVTRVARYVNFQFQNRTVETVWTGQIKENTAEFTLKKSDVLTAFNGFKLSKEDLQQTTRITVKLDLQASLSVGSGTETWTLQSADPGESFLWTDLRQKILLKPGSENWLIKAAQFLGIKKVIDSYQKQAAQSEWADRSEFKNKQHFAIVDRTDFDFYQKNNQVVRVTNKTLNPVSLAEATMRLNAYGKKFYEKAHYFENETLNYNLNPAGMLEIALVDEQQNKMGSVMEYDSALWTGMYIWSQVLRYKQTQDPQAYENVKKALGGILTLLEISDTSENFARTVIESPADDQWNRDDVSQGEGPYAHLKWQKIGNNDMSKGLFIAFITAHSILKKQDAALKNEIALATKKMLRFEPIKNRHLNMGITYGLVALYNHDKVALDDYSRYAHNLVTLLSSALDMDSGFYFSSVADWSGIHLTTVSALSHVLLAQELERNFSYQEGSWKAAHIKKIAQDRLMELDETFKPARRDFLTIMTYAYNPQARASKKFKARAEEALWSLREVPAPRKIGSGEVDLTINPDWSISAFPKQPWKALKGPFRFKKDNMEFEQRMQGAYMYPLFETAAWSSTYLWKDHAFRAFDRGSGNTVSFSADYLILYRVALEAKLITPQD